MTRRAGALVLIMMVIGGGVMASAAVIQREGLRITVLSQILPYKLPRVGTAPIAVFISGHIATRSGEIPPQLQHMSIKVNQHGLLRYKGLPTCTLDEINAVSTGRALSLCGDALVGSGRFWATIVLPDQRPYPTRGRLLVFNGRKGGAPVIFAHIFTTKPFATSFVITFGIKKISSGPYGTELSASLPEALGSWGFVDRIKLTLRRRYQVGGKTRSYFNAGCPAPRATRQVVFPLALADFEFAGGKAMAITVTKSCGVKR